jgi:molecular chaperone GrpE
MEEQNQTPDTNTQQAANAAAAPAPEAAAAGADDVARLTQQVAELEAKVKETYDLFMRATAEGEDIRRRWKKWPRRTSSPSRTLPTTWCP